MVIKCTTPHCVKVHLMNYGKYTRMSMFGINSAFLMNKN